MILCCGEALIDMVPVTDVDGNDAFAPLCGGASMNMSVALGRLGIPVGLLSGVSNDLFGAQLVDRLMTSEVSTDLLIRSDRPTTMAFVRLTDGHADYTFYDENSAGRMIKNSDLPDLPNNVSAVCAGGISLCAEPAASSYEALFLREAKHRVTMLDPNIRLGFISNEPAYRARIARMITVADVVKVSDEDLDWIVPKGAVLSSKVQSLHDSGAKVVIVTKGSDGASGYIYGQPVVDVAVPRVRVVDTVGAGDTFNAGFMAKLHMLGVLSKDSMTMLTGAQLHQALNYGAKAAAITVSRAGANPPFASEMAMD